MALATALSRINKAKKAYDIELKKLGRNAKKEIAKEIAKLIPEGYVLWWQGATPSWNDGEPCTYTTDGPKLMTEKVPREVTAEEAEDARADEGATLLILEPDQYYAETRRYVIDDACDPRDIDSYDYDEGVIEDLAYVSAEDLKNAFWQDVTVKRVKALQDAWDELSEDLLEKVFGDPCTILIYSDGKIETSDEYVE